MDINSNFSNSTLDIANFDVLKMDGVEDPLINVNKLVTIDLEESYISKGINFINECRNELTSNKINFYKNLSEATSDTVILESFSDFFSSVKAIIDKFIKFIRSLFDKFVIALMKLVKSDEYLKKHKKNLDNFTDDDSFDFEGYIYTFSQDIPCATAALSYNTSLLNDIYPDKNNMLTADSVKTATTALNANMENILNKFRAEVLGRDDDIVYFTEFPDEVYKTYRNGSSDTERITVDRKFLKETSDRYFNFNKLKKETENNKKQIEDAYESIKKQLQQIIKSNSTLDITEVINSIPASNGVSIDNTKNIKMTADLMTQLDTYVKTKISQITDYSDIHTMAFCGKLDAIKESLRQDKNVLYSALMKIKK